MISTLKNYYGLTKPRLVYGNLVTTLGGVFLGAYGSPSAHHALTAVTGTALIMASGCVFNNLIDRDIDSVMERTKSRASAQGSVSSTGMFAFGTTLLLLGVCIFISTSATHALLVVLTGFIFYVILYSLHAKRSSLFGTHIGAIAGATPPLVGYATSAGVIDTPGLLIFVALFAWQLPHAWSIAMYRGADYAKANIPVLPNFRSLATVRKRMLFYVAIYAFSMLCLFFSERAGVAFALTTLSTTLIWGVSIFRIHNKSDVEKSGKKLFRISLLVIMTNFFVLMLSSK